MWGFAIFGPIILLLGAYVAGGTTVVCTRAETPPAESAVPAPPVIGLCRVQTTRWLGRVVVEERTYPLVTGVSRTARTSTSTSTSTSNSNSRSRSTSYYLLMLSRGVEIESIGAARDQVERGYEAGEVWFGGKAAETLRIDLTDWRFAYGAFGFGTLWLLAVRAIAASSKVRRPRRRAAEEGAAR